jgi:hypothetical protein
MLSGAEFLAAVLEQPRADRSELFALSDQGLNLWPADAADSENYHVSIRLGPQGGHDPKATEFPINESAKLNLHTLLDWEQEFPGHAREALLRLPEMDEPSSQLLLESIGVDIDVGMQGRQTQTRSMAPLIVDQLRWPETDDRADQTRPAWLDVLTTASAQRNESFDGRRRINVNSPDLQVLHQQLVEVLPLAVANYIVLMRQYPVGRTSADSVDAASVNIDFGVPATFGLTSLMDLIESAVATGGSEKTLVVASPMDAMVGAVGMPIDEIFDRLTLTAESRLVGRINILTAPVEVIAAIPGLDLTSAQQIVAARAGADRDTQHPIGILSSTGIDSTIVNKVLAYFTVGGDVVRAELIGSVGEGIPESRCEVIVDASHGRARWTVLNL